MRQAIEWKARLLRHSGSWLPVSAVLVAMICGLGLVATVGVPLGDAIAAFADGAWGSAYAVGASLNRAMALGLVGLGFILANRANLTNVGGEGQAAWWPPPPACTVAQPRSQVRSPNLVPMMLAALAGGLWGSIAGVLKVKVGTNEVISTLLLSFIGVWVLYASVQSVNLLRQPMTDSATLPESLEIPEATRIPLLTGDESVSLHFFGAATALQFQLPAMGVDVPNALLIMLPYVMALLAVAGLVGRQSPPPGLTLPYTR